MRRMLVVIAAVSLVLSSLVMGGVMPVQAQEATPETAADHPIVGSWLADTDPNNPDNFPAFFVFHGDGTYFQEEGDVGVGAWEATGERTAAMTILFRFAAEEGGVTLLKVRATVEVSEDGATFAAPYTLEYISPDGTSSGEYSGTATGERIVVEPMGTPIGTTSDLFGGAAGTPEVDEAANG